MILLQSSIDKSLKTKKNNNSNSNSSNIKQNCLLKSLTDEMSKSSELLVINK